jgi:SAM-dependent MidA family methyltransferase
MRAQQGAGSVSTGLPAPLGQRIAIEIEAAGGFIGFDRYMALALYAPEGGYYMRPRGDAGESSPIGRTPRDGSDFVTAPLVSPLFGRALAPQAAQVFAAAGASEVLEFGAGDGSLAAQMIEALDALGAPPSAWRIVELSGALRAVQRQRLARFGERVQWLEAMPTAIHGLVLGNEVLDAMPVRLAVHRGDGWHERGVVRAEGRLEGPPRFAFADRPAPGLRLPEAAAALPEGSVTEVHEQAEAFAATVAGALVRGAALFIDYGFPEAEYHHPQRTGGTLAAHRGHRVAFDEAVLADPGAQDLTAHVNFTGIALSAQAAGADIAGYTTQAHLLLNGGLAALMEAADLRTRAEAARLVAEHEMGELFKALLFTRGLELPQPIGFARGDRLHRL